MSLISLASTTINDIQQQPYNFKNHFPQPLIIKPHSQVCLVNFYHFRDEGYYRIVENNNTIAFAITKDLGEIIDAIKETNEYQLIQQRIDGTNAALEKMRARSGYENTEDYTTLMENLAADLNSAKMLILDDATYNMLIGQQIINNNLMEASAGTTGDIDTDIDPVEVE